VSTVSGVGSSRLAVAGTSAEENASRHCASHWAWMAVLGQSTTAGRPSRLAASRPISVFPPPGGTTRYVALPARSLAPGDYRVFLTPAAMEEVASMLHWGGFSGRALATRQSSLTRMHDEGVALHPRVTMREATAEGVAPGFQSAGFIRPAEVPLIERGRLVGALTSPRTAREFGGISNGAENDEAPEALSMHGGELPTADALAALDRGLYVGNLWYLNYSDRPASRITGMTRFATFWVEGGRIVAPVNVLRFDDTLFRMLGGNLEALTRETELILDSSTYRQRSLSSMRLPGALLSAMTFTL